MTKLFVGQTRLNWVCQKVGIKNILFDQKSSVHTVKQLLWGIGGREGGGGHKKKLRPK